ncbi:MAG: outer membrane protein assembly factor BamD (BamD/ComL family) [Paraglaciecola sp.]|jgi:outer membrane protein assembly factor BamD (BamD/ComL family)
MKISSVVLKHRKHASAPAMLLFVAFLSACSFSPSQISTQSIASGSKETLGDVYFAPMSLNHDPLPAKSLQDLRDAYMTLSTLVNEAGTKQIVQYRLADLEILLAEQRQESGVVLNTAATSGANAETPAVTGGYYELAIEQYKAILNDHPEEAQNVEVLYQLAKAYEQQGQVEESLATLEQLLQQFPENPYLAEIHFRRGEVLFNRGNYADAIPAYGKVLRLGDYNPYYPTAAYMLGWSHFKMDQQIESLTAFSRLLDHHLPNQIIAQTALEQIDSQEKIEQLSRGAKRLVGDTLRIMALLFSYQDATFEQSGQSVLAHFKQQGSRHYEYLLYDELGQHYLNNDRYRDSAEVYQSFAQHHPAHDQAPLFTVKQIDAYILGKFPTLVLPAKEFFIKQYGISGEYWGDWGVVLQERVSPYLEQYLQELAQYEHSRGQLLLNASQAKSRQESAEKRTSSAANKPPSSKELKQQSMQAYELAANWYKEFIETFPTHRKTPDMIFSMAESLFESGSYDLSIAAFESYAYQYTQQGKAAEAGYAAILAYRLLRSKLATSAPSAEHWQDQQLLSQEKFVSNFPEDERAVDVLHDSMQQLFSLKRYDLAILNAEQLLGWQPAQNAERLMGSHLVIAHSQFALSRYPLAEQKYEQILFLLEPQDKRHSDMQERLAASIYKQAEENVANNYLPLAVTDFLRILAKTPLAKIRLNAQYDAATYLLEMKEWQQASSLLEDFRQRFPSHPLTATIRDKLILAYQQNENWLPAANELIALWKKQPKTEEGRQALYIAAQYYQKEGKIELALDYFRTYAHSYPDPFDELVEAQFALSEFYLQSKDGIKRRYWLNKMIQADAKAKSKRTPRSRYLAAMSSMVFADDSLRKFKRIKLGLPLKSSLRKKKVALNKSLDAYNLTLQYKIEEFSTGANYRIAEIYNQLAKDLMASTKPKNLNALELEQYEILLEEQSYPFEEKSIEVHETNAKRTWQGTYDDWVKQSFTALSKLLPGRYDKQERKQEVTDEIY